MEIKLIFTPTHQHLQATHTSTNTLYLLQLYNQNKKKTSARVLCMLCGVGHAKTSSSYHRKDDDDATSDTYLNHVPLCVYNSSKATRTATKAYFSCSRLKFRWISVHYHTLLTYNVLRLYSTNDPTQYRLPPVAASEQQSNFVETFNHC